MTPVATPAAREGSAGGFAEKGRRTSGQIGGGGGDDGYHPFIQGLLRKLPEADTKWNHDDRVKWLEAAIRIFDLMYQSDDAGIIKVQFDRRTNRQDCS